MSEVIGICGLKGSGKSVAARYFEERGYKRAPFAGPLKAMLAALLRARGVGTADVIRCLDGDLKERPVSVLSGRSPRHAMQTLGTEWGRDLMSPDFWVECWRDAVLHEPRVVADDLRFPNEAAAIRALGGKILRVDRPGVMNGTHISERLLDKIEPDVVLRNVGTVEDLEQLIMARCLTP